MNKFVKILYNPDCAKPYAVFVLTNRKWAPFWHQVSEWYLRKGNARRFLEKYIRESKDPEINCAALSEV